MIVYCCKCLCTWNFSFSMTSLIQYINLFPPFLGFISAFRMFFSLSLPFRNSTFTLDFSDSHSVPSIKATSCFTFNFTNIWRNFNASVNFICQNENENVKKSFDPWWCQAIDDDWHTSARWAFYALQVCSYCEIWYIYLWVSIRLCKCTFTCCECEMWIKRKKSIRLVCYFLMIFVWEERKTELKCRNWHGSFIFNEYSIPGCEQPSHR